MIPKRPKAQQQPEEIEKLKQLLKKLKGYLDNDPKIELDSLCKFIKDNSVFEHQFATTIHSFTKENKDKDSIIKILYIIDQICKEENQGRFRDAIKDYIKKIYLLIFFNQKKNNHDLEGIKIIFKSWVLDYKLFFKFNIFSLQILLEISKEVSQRFNYDLDNITQQQKDSLKKFYTQRSITGFQKFLDGSYKQSHVQQTVEPPKIKKVQIEREPAQNLIMNYGSRHVMMPQIHQQQIIQQQILPIQGMQINQQLNQQMNQHQQISQPISQQAMMQYYQQQIHLPQQIQQQIQKQQIPPVPQQIPQQIQQQIPTQIPQPQQIYRNDRQDRVIELNSESIFGGLFKYFQESTNQKQIIFTKSLAKDFLKKQMQSQELLYNPNKFSSLMKCSMCLLRFRNEDKFKKHIEFHSKKRLEKFNRVLNNDPQESDISMTVEQWFSNQDEVVQIQQTEQIRLELDKLKSDKCAICQEILYGQWDPVQCVWYYENVVTIRIESLHLDDQQPISIHLKCQHLLKDADKQ